ncbi:MAG: hypothetical protein RIC53_16565 [Cyclobacteriaceae bacterium]
MKNTATYPVGDYKKLYEESLLAISKNEEELIKERQLNISKDEQITQLSFERSAAAVGQIPAISFWQ